MRFAKVYVELTNICGQACTFCPSRSQEKRVMSLAAFHKVLEQLRPYTKTLALHLFGDPLALKSLPQYMDSAHEQGFGIHVVTNGFHLKNHSPALLSHPALIQLNISLNAASTQNEEKLEAYLKEVAAWCVYKRNHAPKPFVNLRLWNRGGHEEDLMFSKKICTFLSRTFPHAPLVRLEEEAKVYRLDEKIRLHVERYFMWPSLEAPVVPEGPCYGLRSHIGVLSDGTVVPCCLDGGGIMALGTLFYTPLHTILTSSKAQAMRKGFDEKKAVEPLCKRCDFRKRFL